MASQSTVDSAGLGDAELADFYEDLSEVGKSDPTEGTLAEEMEVTEGTTTKKKKNRKRQSGQTNGQNLPKRFRVDPVAFHKNPLMALNEFRPGLKFVVDSMEGPPHNPKFTASVEFNDKRFSGTGRSKQDAKQAAAQAVLASFSELHTSSATASSSFGSPNDEVGYPDMDEGAYKRLRKIMKSGEDKNPLMMLNELHPGLEFNLVAENAEVSSMRFTMSVIVKNQTFEGSGQSKKQAKIAAATAVLTSMYGLPLNHTIPCIEENVDFLEPLSQSLADKIAEATFAKYAEVMKIQSENHKKWEMLASICMTDDDQMENVSVIALSTGAKCITSENVSMNGATLNDSHAEVLAHRCFKGFLYDQLRLHTGSRDESLGSVLTPLPTGGYRLKDNVKFHMYITGAPCGDARSSASFYTRGFLCSKTDSVEGSTPVKPHEAYQKYEAIRKGQRLLIMSCSDKIAKWNVLGMQGALLSQFVEPIYLNGLVIGSSFDNSQLFRAVGGRIRKHLSSLPEHYCFHVPKMCSASDMEACQPSKYFISNHSMNWRVKKQVEIINARIGKCQNNQISDLSKRNFFRHFCVLKDELPMLRRQLENNATMYVKAKAQAKDYQAAKENMLQAFKTAGFGLWVKKPEELGHFEYGF